MDEDNKQRLLTDENDAFNFKELAVAQKELYDDISTEETTVLNEYLLCSVKKDKAAFIASHTEVNWSAMEPGKDGTYSKATVNRRISEILKGYRFEEGSYGYVLSTALALNDREKSLKKNLKEKSTELHLKTKDTIESLSEDQISDLLEEKWICPLVDSLTKLPDNMIIDFVKKLESLANKYKETFAAVETQIEDTEKELSSMLDELTGNEFDMKGIEELKKLLGGI